MLERRGRKSIPTELGVEVGVDINKTWREYFPSRIHFMRGLTHHLTHRRDDPIFDGDITRSFSPTCTIDDTRVADNKIEVSHNSSQIAYFLTLPRNHAQAPQS